MAKTTITKKQIPNLKKDLIVDNVVLEEIKKVQDVYKKEMAATFRAAKKTALDSYTARIASLKTEKANMLKEYNDEIKKYEGLVKRIKGRTK